MKMEMEWGFHGREIVTLCACKWLLVVGDTVPYARTWRYSCEARQDRGPRQPKRRHRKKHSERMSEARQDGCVTGQAKAKPLILVLVLCLNDPGLDTCYIAKVQVQVQGP